MAYKRALSLLLPCSPTGTVAHSQPLTYVYILHPLTLFLRSRLWFASLHGPRYPADPLPHIYFTLAGAADPEKRKFRLSYAIK